MPHERQPDFTIFGQVIYGDKTPLKTSELDRIIPRIRKILLGAPHGQSGHAIAAHLSKRGLTHPQASLLHQKVLETIGRGKKHYQGMSTADITEALMAALPHVHSDFHRVDAADLRISPSSALDRAGSAPGRHTKTRPKPGSL